MLSLCVAVSACNKAEQGPKREDHEAAHTPRYHPEVERADATGRSAHTQPASSMTQPSDIEFDTGPIGSPVMFINGEPLTVSDVLEPIIGELRDKAENLSLSAYRNALFRTVNSQIEYQISTVVIYQEAEREYVDEQIQMAFDREAQRMIDDLVNRRYGGVYARYEAHLKQLELTLEDVKKRAKRQAMVMYYLRELFKPVTHEPTRRELMKYYKTHLDEFTTAARAELFLIEIPYRELLGKPFSKASQEEQAQARTQARRQLEEAVAALEQGTPFEQVARQYSKGIRAQTGGAWGEITRGSLTGRWAPVEKVLFTLEADRRSGIIEGDTSAFIVQCGQFTPRRRLPFEEAQEQIMQRLMDQDFDRRRRDYVQRLLARAIIQRREEFFRAVVAAAPLPAVLTRPQS